MEWVTKYWVVVVVSLSGPEKPPKVSGIFRQEQSAKRWAAEIERQDKTVVATVCQAPLMC